jgi:hypothetical protein
MSGFMRENRWNNQVTGERISLLGGEQRDQILDDKPVGRLRVGICGY